MGWKDSAKKVWHFLFVEDSALSWLVNLGLAFLLVKYLLYPGLALALGTQLPLVAVISGSMEHNGVAFDQWWDSKSAWYEERNITKEEFQLYSFLNGFDKGDVMILAAPENVHVGDVLVYSSATYQYPIIHRVVAVSENGYTVKGDHNNDADPFVSQEQVVGKALYRIPKLGWVKIGAVGLGDWLKGVYHAVLS